MGVCFWGACGNRSPAGPQKYSGDHFWGGCQLQNVTHFLDSSLYSVALVPDNNRQLDSVVRLQRRSDRKRNYRGFKQQRNCRQANWEVGQRMKTWKRASKLTPSKCFSVDFLIIQILRGFFVLLHYLFPKKQFICSRMMSEYCLRSLKEKKVETQLSK